MDMTRAIWETLLKGLDYLENAADSDDKDEDEAAEEEARLEEASDWLDGNRPE